MWILNWLPDVVFHLILGLGLLALLISWMIKVLPVKLIPMAMQYRVPLQIVGVMLTVLGVWYEGGIAKDAEWKVKVAEAEKKSAETNTQIVTKYITRTKKIQGKRDEIIKYVDREIIKYDDQCVIPKQVIEIMNEAAKGTE